jgi:hypothetical protein
VDTLYTTRRSHVDTLCTTRRNIYKSYILPTMCNPVIHMDLRTNIGFFLILNNNNNNHGSTALYGLGPPLSAGTKSCAFVAVGDWKTGRATILSIPMCPPEPEPAYVTFLFMPVSFFYRPTALLPLRRKWCSGFLSPLKIHRPRSGSNPRT